MEFGLIYLDECLKVDVGVGNNSNDGNDGVNYE